MILNLLKESKYVRLANTIYRVLRNSRIPRFFIERTTIYLAYGRSIRALLTGTTVNGNNSTAIMK